jgi:hypothetical protein
MSDHEFHKPAHKGYWIPVELDRFGLSNIEKLLLSIIDSLDDPEKHCYASNGYLSEQMGLSISRISFYLTKFKKMNLIEEVSFSGRQRIIRVCKENWYVKELKNSKKESYVKTRRQTTCLQEGRLRENTHHIVKCIEKLDQQPQTPSLVVVDFYSCISQLDLPNSDKQSLMKFDEDRVSHAVEWATHKKTKITKTLIQALIWHCKQENPPAIPLDEDKFTKANVPVEEHKSAAQKLQDMFKVEPSYPNRYISATDSSITFKDKIRDIYQTIPYADREFWPKFKHMKQLFNLKT